MAVNAPFHTAIERNRRRIWAVCYRMTGSRTEADDLTQEVIARAIERAHQLTAADPTGWLLTMATRLCLDHLRHRKIERRVTSLVDPLDVPDWPAAETPTTSAEDALLLREDVRYAVVVALQKLSPRQRAALVLHYVCDLPLEEVAPALSLNVNATKALLHRARAALARARQRSDVDLPVDAAVVERFARAIEAGSIDTLTELLAEDVWGVADGGGIVQTASKPTFGKRTVARQWANAKRRLGVPVVTEVRVINGEPAVVIRLASATDVVVAIAHLETRDGRVVALRVNRDPRKLRVGRAS
jgi:RNA polymerase sigma-70 factor, ECF subfamily